MNLKQVLINTSCVLLLMISSTSHAAITTFTDRTTWATNGVVLYTEDFEGCSTDTSFLTSPLDVGPFTLATNGINPDTTRNIVDVSPHLFPTLPSSFGNVAVDIKVDVGLTADIIFDNPVSGFFADFENAGNLSELILTLALLGGGSTDLNVPGPGNSLSPFGFFSLDQFVTSIRFSNTLNDGFYIDNISASVVPVPAAIWLFGTALIGLVGFSKQRKAA